jgi:hypothetical protein
MGTPTLKVSDTNRGGRILRGLVIAGALCLLSACDRSPDLLVLLDPFLSEALTVEGLTRDRLQAATDGAGRSRVEIRSPGNEADSELRSLLGRLSPRGVYLSPLLAPAVLGVGAEFSEIVFFVDGPLPPSSPPVASNVRVVRYDYTSAYSEAGRILGSLLLEQNPPEALGAFVRERRGGVAAVAVRPDKSTRRELQVFQESLLESGAVEGVEYRELNSLEDRAAARRSLERLKDDGVGVFLLRTATLTGFCLEVLQAQEGLAIVEDVVGLEAYADVLLLSLARDFPAALRQMAIVSTGGLLSGEADPGTVSAPVRLRWWITTDDERADNGKEPDTNE